MFVLLCAISVVVVALFCFCFGCVGSLLILALSATSGSFVLAQCKFDRQKYPCRGFISLTVLCDHPYLVSFCSSFYPYLLHIQYFLFNINDDQHLKVDTYHLQQLY